MIRRPTRVNGRASVGNAAAAAVPRRQTAAIPRRGGGPLGKNVGLFSEFAVSMPSLISRHWIIDAPFER